jgi:hypothetical protein
MLVATHTNALDDDSGVELCSVHVYFLVNLHWRVGFVVLHVRDQVSEFVVHRRNIPSKPSVPARFHTEMATSDNRNKTKTQEPQTEQEPQTQARKQKQT